MRAFRHALYALPLLWLAVFSPLAGAPAGLRVNGRTQPDGISAQGISFSWHDPDGTPADHYRIEILDAAAAQTRWTSPLLSSAENMGASPDVSTVLRSGRTYSWRVQAVRESSAANEWSEAARFHIGLERDSDWVGAKWIRPGAEAHPDRREALPVFRQKLEIRGEIAEAWLYATAHGVYSAYINGNKAGDALLAPGWTDYTKRLQTQSYDVTALLRQGVNIWGVALGDGWFRGRVGLGWSKVYGETPAFLGKLRVRYKDGSLEEFFTGEGWEWTAGPFSQADLQNGEHYDGSVDLPTLLANSESASWRAVDSADADYSLLFPQPDEPVRELLRLPALKCEAKSPHCYQADFGQNLVGVVRVHLRGKPGATVTLRHAEELYRTGQRKGDLYTDNLRSARAEDRVVLPPSGELTYQPTFTQHGFRYVELSGEGLVLYAHDIKAVVFGSDLRAISQLTTSSELLNQLISNVRWGQRGNFLSIPTDTPARDERLGWTGDIAVFAAAANRLTDARAFLSKWLADVRDAQKPDGNLPAIVPQPRREFDESGVGWSDAAVQVPYAVWRATGDRTFLRRHWPLIRDAYRFIFTSATRDGDFLEQGRMSWFSGDWLSLEDVKREVEHPIIATAYLVHDSRLVAEMAEAIGDHEILALATETARKAAEAFVRAHIADDGRIEPGTQTVYALALGMDVIADGVLRKKVADRFVEKILADKVHLRTGFLGTPWLLPALERAGRADLALQLLLNEDYPSWGYEIKMGATTIWERWNSIQPNGEFGPVEMNSFNHYAYGAVLDWVYSRIGGVEILEAGYRRVRIAPLVDHPSISHSELKIETPLGSILVSWKRVSQETEYEVSLPAGCVAELEIDGTLKELEGGRHILRGRAATKATSKIAGGL